MASWWRRLVVLALIGGLGFVVVRRRGLIPAAASPTADRAASSASWPPITTDDGAPADPTAGRVATERSNDLRSFAAVAEPAGAAPAWVLPVDGRCPDGYPIKANDNSRIFHVPGGRFYDRTVPERCYAEAEGALADGYRAAKA